MRNVAIAAAAGLGLICAGTFAGGASAMVGAGTTMVQSVAQDMSGTQTVAAKKKMRHHAMRRHRAMGTAAVMETPHFGGTMVMGKQCWVDPDGRGVTGYWTMCK